MAIVARGSLIGEYPFEERFSENDVLKISCTQANSGAATLLLEGRLLGPWVDELESAVIATGAGAERICLNLAGVQFADAAGVRLLRRLSGQGIHLEGLSPFIRELLSSTAARNAGPATAKTDPEFR